MKHDASVSTGPTGLDWLAGWLLAVNEGVLARKTSSPGPAGRDDSPSVERRRVLPTERIDESVDFSSFQSQSPSVIV